MSKLRSVRKRLRGTTALRAAAILALAALAGCTAYGTAVVDAYPEDVRLRHPISLREGPKTLELFVRVNRGGLSPAQRADLDRQPPGLGSHARRARADRDSPRLHRT